MKLTTFVAYAFMILFVAGCGTFAKAKAAAEVSIDHFHQLYNEGKLEIIWNEAHAKFRSTMKKEHYDEVMGAVRLKYGKAVSTSNLEWGWEVRVMSTTIWMIQMTRFEKGEATETFNFEMDGEKALLLGYDIQ